MTNVNTPILNLPPAIALTGAEAVPCVQDGVTSRTTVNDIARLVIQGTYANNAAAIAGGLSPEDFYQTATGEVRVVV